MSVLYESWKDQEKIMNKRIIRFLAIGLSSLALVACGSTPTEDPGIGGDAVVEDRDIGATYEGGLDGSESTGSALDDNPLLSTRTIYFDFDRDDIKPEYREILEAHARYLYDNNNTKITLAGHCDERGTREYNLALGERRANAVSRLMTMLGAGDSQLDKISYGEEQPVDMGHHESAWSQNRRVEIIYP